MSELVPLQAREGYYLTNGKGCYGKIIYLGVNDSANNWYEITDAEYELQNKEPEVPVVE